MIDLITGLPGNCKTLYTISWVRKWSQADNRPVFYSGIPLSEEGREKLGWTEIDPQKWMECPPGAIIVIDECQRVFRNRSINSQPPQFVTELETHRHKGVDLVFITQHPMLIDPAIRRLTGRHRHMVRIWGMEASTVHEWNAVRENCDKPAGRKDSEKTKWVFDKSVYSLYKSAELHTGKKMIPKRILWLAAVPVAILAAVFTVKGLLLKKPAVPGAPGQVVQGQIQGTGGQLVPQGQGKVFDPIADAKEYAFNETPRVQGLPHTAPKYDALTKPVRVPVPAACIQSQTRCQCYSQQGTPMPVGLIQCIDIARNGYFQDFDPDGERHDRERASQAVAVLEQQDRLPISGASTKDRAGTLSADGYGVLGKAGSGVRQPGQQEAPVSSPVYPVAPNPYNQRQANQGNAVL